MRVLVLGLLLAGCAPLRPARSSDLQFCTEDTQCVLHRSGCGKVVSFHQKFTSYVQDEFRRREEGRRCQHPPDERRYRTRCEQNACTLIELD